MSNKIRLRSDITSGVAGEVDRDKGIIFGVAIITEGEAKGHGVNLDSEFVQDTVNNTNAKKMGLKARFGHPNMSSTAFGTYVGRIKNATFDDSSGVAVARGDLHLSKTAKTSPNGDMFTYVLDMAEEDPDMFGTSIVFSRGRLYKRDESGDKQFEYLEDGSLNEDYKGLGDKEFIEQKELFFDDVVDDPAANPDGLFSAFSNEQPAAIVTEFLDSNPQIWELLNSDDVEAIFTSFRERYNSYKSKFQTQPKEMEMEKDNKKDAVEVVEVDLSQLRTEFGAEKACDYFAKNLTLDAAKLVHYESQKAEIVTLKAELEAVKLAAKAAEGADPIEHLEAKIEPKEDPKEPTMDSVVAEFQLQGLSFGQAVNQARKEHPELCKDIK